jgi:hypothetical protein
MITENDVVEKTVQFLQGQNFHIINQCNTYQKGIDIEAYRGEITILIEAKGGTTSKDTSKKGQPFDRNQVKTHVSVALLKIMQLKEEYMSKPNIIFGIALPYEKNHIEIVGSIQSSLKELKIIIFWCDETSVHIDEDFSAGWRLID